MVIGGGVKRLRESWTDTGQKMEFKHTLQRIDETPKRNIPICQSQNRLVELSTTQCSLYLCKSLIYLDYISVFYM